MIGIVSGPHCDGQVVVLHDMLGYGGGHPPRSVKQYATLHDVLVKAFRAFDGWVVVVRVIADADGSAMRLLGASSSEDEEGLERASAQAVLDATNRILTRYVRS